MGGVSSGCVEKVCVWLMCVCVWPKCVQESSEWVVKKLGGQVGGGQAGVWPKCVRVWPKCVYVYVA